MFPSKACTLVNSTVVMLLMASDPLQRVGQLAHKIEMEQAPFDVAGFAKPYVSNIEDEEVHGQQGHASVVKGSWPCTWGSFALSTENRGDQKSVQF